jgi:predicted metalloprotease
VIAHEVGHHVQKLTGGFDPLDNSRGRISNQASVRLELQADCYSGIWGHYASKMNQLDPGDVQEALNAAVAIGDDRIQKQMQGRVAPEAWTHGSSEQRLRWLKRGLDSGRPQDCDTSAAGSV